MKLNKKVLVTGGDGMVGNYFTAYKNCIVLGKSEFDVTKPATMRRALAQYKPDAIVHLAAMTNVDAAEKTPNKAFQVNAEGARKVAELAQKHGLHMVYVSTGAVFSGKARRPYTTNSKTDPVNTYALSKRIGEEYVSTICDKHSIVRTGWVFGGFERDKKFVALIAKQIWQGNKDIKAVADTFGCPTYGKDLAEAILLLIEHQAFGLFHGVNKGHASRYEIAKVIASTVGNRVKVKSASIKEFPSFGAPRPRFEVIEQNIPMRSWRSALREYLADWQDLREGSATLPKTTLLQVDLNGLRGKYSPRQYYKYIANKA